MKKTLILILLFVVLCSIVLSVEFVPVSAYVEPDSGKEHIKVENIQLDFKFAGLGYYLPSKYPILNEIPLENGEIVLLSKIAEATFKPIRVEWKKFIPENERKNTDDVDNAGYQHWKAVEVDCFLKDWNGNIIKSRMKRPDYSDIFLVGATSRGKFSLQVDQENGKIIHVLFQPNFILQCSKEKKHLFPNSMHKYCPHCGGELKKIPKP